MIVYYGRDWELGTDTSQLPPRLQKKKPKNLSELWTKGMVIMRQGEMIKWKILDICCFRLVFNKGWRGLGRMLLYLSEVLPYLWPAKDEIAFPDLAIPPAQSDRPGREMRLQSSSRCNDSDADKCSDWNHMWPGARPSPGCWEHPCKAKGPSVEIRLEIFLSPVELRLWGLQLLHILIVILCDLSGSKLQPCSFASLSALTHFSHLA